ncbi:MAG: methyltransferase domain-containing protein, partial [Acinetobacter sp.]
MMIQKSQVAQRFAKAHQSYDAHALVQKQIYQHLMQLMQQHLPAKQLGKALEVGCGSGGLTRELLLNFQINQLFLNDLYSEVQQHISASEYPETQMNWLIGDIEAQPLPQHLDLALSSSALQWINDLNALLQRIHQVLNPQAYLCFSTFGPQNLQEIKALTGQGLHYQTLPEIQALLNEAGFEVLHLSES